MENRRWLKIGSGIAATITTVAGLFILISLVYNFQIVDLTGNIVCEGTYQNPCISEFEVKNPNAFYVDIYSKDQVKLDFNPRIRDYALFVVDGRCSAIGQCACDLKNGEKLGFKGWRCVDFTNKTKPRADKEYNFRFERYSTTKFRLAGIKNSPQDNVKWAFETNNGNTKTFIEEISGVVANGSSAIVISDGLGNQITIPESVLTTGQTAVIKFVEMVDSGDGIYVTEYNYTTIAGTQTSAVSVTDGLGLLQLDSGASTSTLSISNLNAGWTAKFRDAYTS